MKYPYWILFMMCVLGLKWPKLMSFNIYVAGLIGLAMPFFTGDFKQWS